MRKYFQLSKVFQEENLPILVDHTVSITKTKINVSANETKPAITFNILSN